MMVQMSDEQTARREEVRAGDLKAVEQTAETMQGALAQLKDRQQACRPMSLKGGVPSI